MTRRKRKSNQKGFTLIELVVVIAILGILAAIAIPRIGNFRQKAEETAQKADIRSIEAAAQLYYADNNKFPANISELTNYLDKEIIEKYEGGTFNETTGKFILPDSPSPSST